MAAELPALRSFLGPKFDPAQPISVDIVVVPGLRIFKDDLGALWTAPAWPERVFERLTNRQARLNAYEYSLWDDDGGIFTPKGARAEARKLLDFLTERRRGQLKQPTLVFLGLDVGAVLVKEAMLLARERQYQDIHTLTMQLVFLDYPYRADVDRSGMQAAFVQLLRLLPLWMTSPSQLTDVAGPLADWIHETHCAFSDARLSLAFLQKHYTFSRPEPEQASKEEAGDGVLSADKGAEKTVVAPENPVLAPILYALLDDLDDFAEPLDAEVERLFRSFTARAYLRRPTDVPARMQEKLEHFAAHTIVQNWAKSNEMDIMFLHAPNESISVLQYVLEYIMEVDKDKDKENASLVLVFPFDRNDCRCDSVESMLCNAMTELILQAHTLEGREKVKKAVENMDLPHRNFTKHDLLIGFIDIILETLASTRKSEPETSYLLLDEIDESIKGVHWLLRKLQALTSGCELPFKIAMASCDLARLTVDLSPVPTLDVFQILASPVTAADEVQATKSQNQKDLSDKHIAGAEKPDEAEKQDEGTEKRDSAAERQDPSFNAAVNPTKPSADPIELDWFTLIQARPQLYGQGTVLKKVLGSCGYDFRLRQIITTWLRVGELPSSNADLGAFLSELQPASPDEIFSRILASLLPNLPDLSWSRGVLEWILLAPRPLSLNELLDLLQHQEQQGIYMLGGCDDNAWESRLERVFGGLVAVEYQEVRLAHPDLRDYLLRSGGIVGGSISRVGIEGRMAESCLTYLSSAKARELMTSPLTLTETIYGVFENRENFLCYAMRYWLSHAELADWGDSKNTTETPAFQRFLENDEMVCLWVKIYRALGSTPSARGEEAVDPASSLAIFAEWRVERLFSQAMRKYRDLPSFNQRRFEALVAATGAGNLEIARMLDGCPIPEGKSLDEPILAAIESGHAIITHRLLDEAHRASGSVKNLEALLIRAASLGNKAAVERILTLKNQSTQSEQSEQAKNGLKSSTPLHYACQRNHGDVVDVLLSSGADVRAVDPYGNSALDLALKFGHHELVGRLVNAAVASKPENQQGLEEYFASVLATTCRFGQHRALDALLDSLKSRDLGSLWDIQVISKCLDSKSLKCARIAVRHLQSPLVSSEDAFREAVKAAIRLKALDICEELMKVASTFTEEPVFGEYMEEATKTGDLEVVKFVFETGAKSPGMTEETLALTATRSLRAAVLDGNESAAPIPYLVEKGADLKSRHVDGRTPLYSAVYQGWIPGAKALIKAGADVNALGDGDWRPIHAAFDDAELTRTLIEATADVNLKTDNDWTAMYLAAKWDHVDVVRELLKANPDKETIQSGLSAATWAGGNAAVYELLLDACPDASYLPPSNDLLHGLVGRSSAKAVMQLLSFPIDPHQDSGTGYMPLHNITSFTAVDTVKLLLRRGASLDSLNTSGNYTPLIAAVNAGNMPVARLLVERGARVNIPGDIWTGGAFHLACHNGNLEMVKLLRQSKTDPADVDAVSRGIMGTPLQAALYREESGESDESDSKAEVVRYLVEEARAQVNVASEAWGGSLFLACINSSADTVRLLLRHGADAHAKDHIGRTPLHFALYRTLEIVKQLVEEYNASLDDVDVMERHALHFAVVSGRLDVVRYVLEKRPHLADKPDVHGWTPLLWALRICGRWRTHVDERKEIVEELLVKHKVRRLVKGEGANRTWTPMMLAKFYGLSEEVMQLVTPTDEEMETEEGESWNWKEVGTKKAVETTISFCDACLLTNWGVYYYCIPCEGMVTFCFKCYFSADKLHKAHGGHEFEPHGSEEDDSEGVDGEEDQADNDGDDLSRQPEEETETTVADGEVEEDHGDAGTEVGEHDHELDVENAHEMA